MAKKLSAWKTRGMNQDLSVSAFNPEFSFENMNLRLSTNENNTLLSWVNEKGTKLLNVSIVDYEGGSVGFNGVPIGTAILNHQLVVFTHHTKDKNKEDDKNIDYIYKFEKPKNNETTGLIGLLLFSGDLNFSTSNPLETRVSYETDDIQKVYFTDGVNQPRLINIADEDSIEKWSTDTNGKVFFDFLPEVNLENHGGEMRSTISVTKDVSAGGLFAPGVIQYCFTYIHKNAQQTNIIDVSPLEYLTHADRGASPEEKVGCSFSIDITNVDTNYDYIRLYSIQRTSIDATPICKILDDIAIKDLLEKKITIDTGPVSVKYLLYTDNGTTGSTIDPTELLYIGGKEITVLTMVDKDQTLFMGNITVKNSSINDIQHKLDELNTDSKKIEFIRDSTKYIELGNAEGIYAYKNNLKYSQKQITTFKKGEKYRFGMQFQKATGEWSEPVFIGDYQNNLYPKRENNIVQLPYASKSFNVTDIGINNNIYKRVRPVIVYPSVADRNILCQGVLNPTVFNVEDRMNGTPYSQASWFFRPYGIIPDKEGVAGTQPDLCEVATFTHYEPLYDHNTAESFHAMNDYDSFRRASQVEIQGSKNRYANPYGTKNDSDSNTEFFIDQSIVTLNSPDIDFDTDVQTYSTDGLKLRIVGAIPIHSTASSHSITTSRDLLETAKNLNTAPVETSEIKHNFGLGETNVNVFHTIIDAVSSSNGSRMIAGNFWNDAFAIRNDQENLKYPMIEDDPNLTVYKYEYETEGDWILSSHMYPINFFVHPWNRTASLNNDYSNKNDASSVLKTKKMANLLYSYNTYYLSNLTDDASTFEHITTKFHLQENEQILNIRLSKQKATSSAINYYPNIDKVLINTDGYKPLSETFTLPKGQRYNLNNINWGDSQFNLEADVKDPIVMRYKSTSHAIIGLQADDLEDSSNNIPILPWSTYQELGKYQNPDASSSDYRTFWGDTKITFKQKEIDSGYSNFLWIGELYKTFNEEEEESKFGGKNKNAIKNNNWVIAGDTVNLSSTNFTLNWTVGDTYYQRYDCLKTYPFTNEDTNQLIEILSFMCETHVNIDGRYDANRGQINNVNMSPENFNLINDVYSQVNNFFINKKTSDDESTDTAYPNWVAYSKTKESGADVDLWTNVTLGSTLELDGDKGKISSLQRFNDSIIAFQDSAVSQILFNSNVQIASTAGVPIELANSGKVDGKKYLSDTIGCSNKWSIASSPAGIYFMDSNNKGIYMFNGQVNDISTKFGFNTWAKKNITSGDVWNPVDFNNFVSYYDKLNQEVLFISKETALAYSEKIGAFTSFYNYGNTPYFCNFDSIGLWIKPNGDTTNIYQHQAGEYCDFFGSEDVPNYKSYWMTLIGNPEPQADKTFTNIEFRASVEGDGELEDRETGKFTPTLPFNSLETWNEYQHGYTSLNTSSGHSSMTHHTSDMNSSLKRKFRIWRCDIPRNNCLLDTKGEGIDDRKVNVDYPYSTDSALGISRYIRKPLDRMRNPWLYLKLSRDKDTNKKTEIHDITMTYFT